MILFSLIGLLYSASLRDTTRLFLHTLPQGEAPEAIQPKAPEAFQVDDTTGTTLIKLSAPDERIIEITQGQSITEIQRFLQNELGYPWFLIRIYSEVRERAPNEYAQNGDTIHLLQDQKILTSTRSAVANLFSLKDNDYVHSFERKNKLLRDAVQPSFSPFSTYIKLLYINTLEIWKLPSLIRSFEAQSGDFSPNEKQLIVADKQSATIWALPNLDEKLCEIQTYIEDPIFSPCATHIAAKSTDKTIRLWNAEGAYLHDFPFPYEVGHFSFSPNGEFFLTTSNEKSFKFEAKIWKIPESELFESLDACFVEFLNDNQRFVAGFSDNTIQICNLFSKETLVHFIDLRSINHKPLISPDGAHILMSARLWKVSGELVFDYRKNGMGEFSPCEFSYNGDLIVSCGGNTMDSRALVFCAKTGEVVRTLESDDGIFEAKFQKS